MNTIQKAAVCLTIIAASLTSAIAAPSATRHGKLLSIKQRVMINTGESRTSASLVSPTAHSNKSGLVALTNSFAAVPLPEVEVNKFQAAHIPRFNYESFWTTMAQLQACENQLAANSDSYNLSYNDNGDEYRWYRHRREPTSPKTYANMLMANYPVLPGGLPVQYSSGDLTACQNGGNTAPFVPAAMVREAVSNYAVDSPEVLDYVTSQYWIKTSNQAAPLKAAVVQYLRENEIDFAWVDVEFEYNHVTATPNNRRVSMSFQISRADEPTTRGSYLGSQLVLAPDVTPLDAASSVRANHIDIKYTAFTQYPDFTINSSTNNQYMSGLVSSGGFNANGVLSWLVTQKGASAISPRLCSNISNCGPTSGSFKSTSGAYDPSFMRSGYNEDPSAPYTLDNPNPLDDMSGIKCLITGRGSQRCHMDKHNVSSLMQYSNSVSGTLDYLGRWEVALQAHPPLIEEVARAGIFDVCAGVEFQNSINVEYWVRRPHWKMNLSWQSSGVDYQVVEQKFEFEQIAKLPDPVRYTTWATSENNYNLTGSVNEPSVRANQMPSTPDGGNASNYASVNLIGYDPQSFGMPDREGAIVINPFVSLVAPNGLLYNAEPNNWLMYRPIGSLTVDDTLAPYMKGNPIYKKATLGTSKALPRRWLGRGGNPLVRTTDFQCDDQNEPMLDAYIQSAAGVPSPTHAYDAPPADPVLPLGDVPFAGTVGAHKANTRPDANSSGAVGSGYTFDPCQISYVPWRNVQSEIITTGPMPDPYFVPPSTCDFRTPDPDSSDPPPVPPGPECFAPINYYTKHVQINRAQDLTYIGQIQPACNEMCEWQGDTRVKLCPRPWARF